MNKRIQLACAWCGPIFGIVFFVGMIMAGLLPPTSPHDTAHQVAHFWHNHPTLTEAGLLLMLIAGGLTAPYGALLCVMLRRMEPKDSPMTYLQLVGVACGVIAIIVPTMMFMAAAFRPDRMSGFTYTISDLAWIPFIVNFPPALMQTISVGAATLADTSPDPVFPRWVGFYNWWSAVLFLPGGLAIFFKTGPFAWNGLIAFWLEAVLFGAWFWVMSFVMIQAVNKRFADSPTLAPEAAQGALA